jgi:hypothetical protein
MIRPFRNSDGYVQILFIGIVVVVLIGLIALLVSHDRSTSATNQTNSSASISSGCVSKQFSTGSTGHCVSDIQTLVNYTEHSGLTECPFSNGATLIVNGSYDSLTSTQVRSIQQWSDCYAEQEGFTSDVMQTGTVDKATWGELCTYGYTDPLHTSAKGATTVEAAGKDAGCQSL